VLGQALEFLEHQRQLASGNALPLIPHAHQHAFCSAPRPSSKRPCSL
jgi:hypothetical protein